MKNLNRREFLKLATLSPLLLISTKSYGCPWCILGIGLVGDFLLATAERSAIVEGISFLAGGISAYRGYTGASRISAVSRLVKGANSIGTIESVGFAVVKQAVKASRKLTQIQKDDYLKILKIGERTVDVIEFVNSLEITNPELADKFVNHLNSNDEISAIWLKKDYENDIIITLENQNDFLVKSHLIVTLKDIESNTIELSREYLLKGEANAFGVYSVKTSMESVSTQGLKEISFNILSDKIKNPPSKKVFVV
jgi:hypothetical protein